MRRWEALPALILSLTSKGQAGGGRPPFYLEQRGKQAKGSLGCLSAPLSVAPRALWIGKGCDASGTGSLDPRDVGRTSILGPSQPKGLIVIYVQIQDGSRGRTPVQHLPGAATAGKAGLEPRVCQGTLVQACTGHVPPPTSTLLSNWFPKDSAALWWTRPRLAAGFAPSEAAHGPS